MKRTRLLILAVVFMVIGIAPILVYGDITVDDYNKKEQLISDFHKWQEVERYLRACIRQTDTNLVKALTIYNEIPVDSQIFTGNLVPKSAMIQLYNQLKNNNDAIKSAYPIFLYGSQE